MAKQKQSKKKYDLISIGRSGVDLYGDQFGGRLEDMLSLSKYVGGCPANIAIGTSRLGLNVAMITRVGNEQMGRYLIDHFAQNGVDTQYIVSDKERLTTLVLLGIQDDTTFPLLYYRQHCADMGMVAADVKEEAIAATKAILISGTHLSAPNTKEMLFHAVKLAAKHGVKVIFDIDYRPTLWGLTDLGGGESRYIQSPDVTKHFHEILPHCDMIVGTDEEFNIAGGSLDPLESLRAIRKLSKASFIYKMGALGCSVVDEGAPVPKELKPFGKSFAVKVLNSVGAGDAFMSGFLSAYLRGKNWNDCATSGNCSGALVVTRHGCSVASPDATEIEYFIKNQKNIPEVPDRDPYFKHLHHVASRPYTWDNLHILAFDHRVQFEVVAEDAGLRAPGKASAKICEAKQLIHDAFEEVRQQKQKHTEIQFGIICDDRYGSAVLEKAALAYNPQVQKRGCAEMQLPLWAARGVEKPLARPLEFDDFIPRDSAATEKYCEEYASIYATPDLALSMRHFQGRHTLKCLIFHHPDDAEELQEEQMRRLNRLYQLSIAHRLELLVEVLAPAQMVKLTPAQVAASIDMIYQHEIFPDWWKLAAVPKQADWDLLSKTITKHDSHCRGILLLGAEKPMDELKKEFALAAKQKLCRGYAIGRSIFGQPCKDWFAGKISKQDAKEKIRANFTQIIDNWEKARK